MTPAEAEVQTPEQAVDSVEKGRSRFVSAFAVFFVLTLFLPVIPTAKSVLGPTSWLPLMFAYVGLLEPDFETQLVSLVLVGLQTGASVLGASVYIKIRNREK